MKKDIKISGNRITILGGGSLYLPVIIKEIIPFLKNTLINEIYLVDINDNNLDLIVNFCKLVVKKIHSDIKICGSTNLNDALPNSLLVITMYRVGGSNARYSDELIGKKYSLGQETQGYGGFASFLRNVSPLKNLILLMKKYCPDAWLLDITNPTGIMTRAAIDLGSKKVIGVCELPFNLRKAIAQILNIDVFVPKIYYAGLNHLGWVYKIKINNKKITNKILKNNILDIFKKGCPNSIINFLTESNLLSKLFNYINREFDKSKTIFSPYLIFYYYFNEISIFQKKTSWTRAKTVETENNILKNEYLNKKINGKWENILKQRGGFLLGETIGPIIHDMLQIKKSNKIHIVCTKNNGVIPFLPNNAVVEIPCRINWQEVKPMKQKNPLNGKDKKEIRELIKKVAKYETLTSKSGISGSPELALNALTTHPMINSKETAEILLEITLNKYKKYLPQFKTN